MPLEYDIRLHAGDPLEVLTEGLPATPHDAVVLQGANGLDGGDIVEEVDALADADGDWLGPARARGRVVVLEGVVTGSTRAGTRSRLTALRRALQPSSVLWVMRIEGRVGDPEPLELPVRVSAGGPFRAPDQGGDRAGAGVPFQVSLRSTDATFRGATEHTVTIDPAATVGGFSYPYSYPYSFGGSLVAGEDIGYGGDTREWPVLRIYGPISTPVLENLTTGRGLYFDGNVAAGDWLEITTAPGARAVLANGAAGASRYGLLNAVSSAWWSLEPGPNLLRLRASDFSGTARAEITYRNRYL